MPQYDQVVLDALENKVTAKGTLKGHLDIYRYCDNVRQGWRCGSVPAPAAAMLSTRPGNPGRLAALIRLHDSCCSAKQESVSYVTIMLQARARPSPMGRLSGAL